MVIEPAGISYSVGTWASELKTTRDVLRRVLDTAGVSPSGKRRGHPVYRGRDVFKAWARHAGVGADGAVDPDALPPVDRKAHYQAEHEKLQLELERGKLVVADEVRRDYGLTFAIVAECFDTMPDVLERDVGLNGAQAARLERHVDQYREGLYQRLLASGAEDADSTVQTG